ncbi:UNVERIFIED_ORG: outer membrane usher protein [Buttiauxella agrestis ATCC 33320]
MSNKANAVHTLCFVLFSAFSISLKAEVKFNPKMLGLESDEVKNIDLDYFSKQGGQTPGPYEVDIYLNQNYIDTRRINFVADKDHKGSIRPEFSLKQLSELGIKVDSSTKIVDESSPLPEAIGKYVSSATAVFNVKNLKLEIAVPQLSLDRVAKGSISPELWDDGINALLLNYNYNGSQSRDLNGNGDSENDFLGIHSGINLKAWRLRYDGNLTRSETSNDGDSSNNNDNGLHWNSLNTYLQRNFNVLQGSQMTLGEYNTLGDLFDSMQFTGMQFASDDDMLPDTMQSFAPTISGIARTTSLLTIRQRGNVVYQTTVPAGPYSIGDLYSTGGSGDLQVTLKGSDGQINEYTVPYSTLPILQREGRYKFSLTGGKYRTGNDNSESPDFLEGTLRAGLPGEFTIYGGTQYSEKYNSYLFGLGKDIGNMGAISLDSTYSNSDLDDESVSGTKNRLQYQKEFTSTDSTFNLAINKYSSGYYSFSDRQDENSTSGSDLEIFDRTHSKKDEYSMSLTQHFQEWGSISFSGYTKSYYDSNDDEKNWQVSYAGNIAYVNYSIAYSETDNSSITDKDKVLSLNLSVPLDRLLSNNSMWLNYNMSSEKHGKTSHNIGLSGTMLDDKNLSYSVTQGISSGDDSSGNSGVANMNYKGGYGNGNLGYSYDPDSRQISYGIQGGMLLHADGITLSQPMNETVVLVKAPGASNVRVENNSGVHTDWRGYTVVPYAQPYRKNRVYLDTRTFGNDIDMDKNINYVIPTKGAVVLAKYSTKVGHRALFRIKDILGKAVPFGAIASVDNGDSNITGIVDESGIVYLTGLSDTGVITIKWNDRDHCSAGFNLPSSDNNSVEQQDLVCK